MGDSWRRWKGTVEPRALAQGLEGARLKAQGSRRTSYTSHERLQFVALHRPFFMFPESRPFPLPLTPPFVQPHSSFWPCESHRKLSQDLLKTFQDRLNLGG